MPVTNEDILNKINDFNSEFTEFRGEMKARVARVEKDVDDARMWENIKIFTVIPVVAGLHSIASGLGWIKK